MKKILRFLRNSTIFVLWTIFFVFVFESLIYTIWGFDILSKYSWNMLFTFWNKGGVFKTAPDIILILFLLTLPYLFIHGYIIVKRINFFQKIVSIISFFFKEKDKDPERIVIKGIKTTEQLVKDVKNEIESLKPEKNKEASSIRTEILKKINKEIKK